MARKRAPSALKSLRPDESRAVLDALLNAHPDLVAEAEGLAANMLDDITWESVAEDVEYALRSLPLEALNDRAGYHPSRGYYTHESEAAGEIIEETLAPYLDDIARRLALGITTPAHQVAAGVLAGLHACDSNRGDGLLGYAGDLDNYAHPVLTLLNKHQTPLPDELLDAACPGWSFLRDE
jgi:hypothetical protein